MRSESEIQAAVAQGKREIRRQMDTGVIPHSVGAFTFLFDHVDANLYCGFLDGERADWSVPEMTEVQLRLDAWLRERPNQAG